MQFTSLPKTMTMQAFTQSVFVGWCQYLLSGDFAKNTTFRPDGDKLTVVPANYPDKEIKLTIPTVVVHRLQEPIRASRMSNVWGSFLRDKDGIQVRTTIYAHRMMGMYQFDLITRDLADQFAIAGYMNDLFQGGEYVDEWGDVYPSQTPGIKAFTVKDITKRNPLTQPYGELEDTDVKVYWRGHQDVSVTETRSFDKSFEQLTYRVEFWSDLWYSIDEYAIDSFEQEIEITDIIE